MESSAAAETQQSRHEPQDDRRANKREMALFYVVGLGISMGLTAVLSCLVFYTATLGLNSFVYLNLAAYAPMFAITVLQARYDTAMDRRYGNSLWVYKFRGHVGFLVIIAALCAMPFASANLAMLCVVTTFLGTATSVLFGSLQQMSSFVYHSCVRLPAALSAGFQSSAILTLVASLSTDFGSSGSRTGIYPFYFITVAVVSISWVSFHVLMHYSRDVAESMYVRDSSLESVHVGDSQLRQMKEQKEDDAVMRHDPQTGTDSLMKSAAEFNTEREEITYRYLWSKSWTSCVSLIFTVISSIMIATWLNRVKSVKDGNPSFPQLLFYIRNFGDMLGRPCTLIMWSPPVGGRQNARFLRRVCIFAILQAFISVPLFYIYVTAPENLLPHNDEAIVLFVAFFAVSAGAIKTIIYQRAPYLLMDHPKISTMQTEQTNLLNICFSVALLLGIFINLVLQEEGNI